jgi:hypothetical protein
MNKRLFIFMGFLALTVSMFAIGLSTTEVLALEICFVGIMPALVAWSSKHFDVMEIIHPILLLYIIYFGVRTLYLVHFGMDDVSRPDFSENIEWALLSTLIGMATLIAGYYSGIGDRLATAMRFNSSALPNRAGYRAVIILFIIGFLCRLYVYSTGYYTRFLAGQRDPPPAYLMTIDYLGYASYYACILGVALAFSKSQGRAFNAAVWLILVPLTIVMALLGGAKTEVMWLVAGILLARHYLIRPIGVMQILIATFAMAFVLLPLVNTYRTISGMNLEISPLMILPLLSQSIGDDASQILSLESIASGVMARFHGIDALSLVMKFTPEVLPFKNGETILLAPIIAFIPSALWSGKYDYINSVASGVEFGEVYFGVAGNTSGVAITQIGELYLNFGWIGIPIGLLIIGCVARFVYITFRRHGQNPIGLLIYTFVYVHLIFIEGWFGSTYSNLLKHLVITSLIVYVIRSSDFRQRRSLPPPHYDPLLATR